VYRVRFSAATTAGRLLPQRMASRALPLLDRIDMLINDRGGEGEAGRISLLAFAIRIVSAVIALVSQVLLARWMGSFEYGIFVLVWVTMIIVGNLSCLGFHTSAIRFIPEYRETGRLAELRGILLTSRLFVLVASTFIAAAGVAGVWLLSDVVESYYVLPFYLGLICLPMIALSDMLQGIARANAWAISALSAIYLGRPLLILAFMALALLAGYAPSAETAILAAIAATYATTIYQLVSVTARIDRRIPTGPHSTNFRLWMAVSLPIFLVEGFFFLLTNADVLMVGFFLDPHDVAVYYATVKVLALVHFVYFAVKAGVAQQYAQLMHADGGAGLARFARTTVSWTFWPSLAMGIVLLLAGKPLLMLFGPGFDEGYTLLFLLVPGVLARAAVGPAESLLTMTGYQNVCAAIYSAALALNIGLNVLLIPQFGLWGAALGTAVATLFEASALAITVWRKHGIVMAIFIPRLGRRVA
jgi:O-antigen/teichoic acid export membrane protein